MSLKDYFEANKGTGVLATADGDGRVNAAIYARPHVLADDKVAFIMADRLTRANVMANPQACYLFREEGEGYRGKRLVLRKIGEEYDQDKIQAMRRVSYRPEEEAKVGELALVTFQVEQERPLLGAGPRA